VQLDDWTDDRETNRHTSIDLADDRSESAPTTPTFSPSLPSFSVDPARTSLPQSD
jgi:hypothetical protein